MAGIGDKTKRISEKCFKPILKSKKNLRKKIKEEMWLNKNQIIENLKRMSMKNLENMIEDSFLKKFRH